MKYEYVLSAPVSSLVYNEKTVAMDSDGFCPSDILREVVKKVEPFAILYNSYTENSIGGYLRKHYPKSMNIYADSGGLQVITLGKKVTESLKTEVYNNQAQYSNFGMMFDEIPLVVTDSTGSKRGDTESRFFDKEKIQHFAEKSADNLIAQIETYNKLGSPARPMMITQGNCYDTTMTWIKCMLDYIPQDLHQYIGGLSSSTACSGAGARENIERAFAMSQVEVPDHMKEHIHLLGVGSISKMIIVNYFKKLFEDNGTKKISYDSSSISNSWFNGNYFGKNGNLFISKTNVAQNQIIVNELKEFTDHPLCAKELTSLIALKTSTEEERRIRSVYTGTMTMVAVDNFIKLLNNVLSNENMKLDYLSKNSFSKNVQTLGVIESADDYHRWKNGNLYKKVKSSNIRVHGSVATLDSLFG